MTPGGAANRGPAFEPASVIEKVVYPVLDTSHPNSRGWLPFRNHIVGVLCRLNFPVPMHLAGALQALLSQSLLQREPHSPCMKDFSRLAIQQLNPKPKTNHIAPTCYRLTREKNSWPGYSPFKCSLSKREPAPGSIRIALKTNPQGWLCGKLVLPLWLVTVEASL